MESSPPFYCFFCSVVVVRCVVVLSVAGVVVPSWFTVAGVDCFVSVWVVVLSVLLACGVGVSPGTTTVVGGGLCWQPVSMPAIISANPGRYSLYECISCPFVTAQICKHLLGRCRWNPVDQSPSSVCVWLFLHELLYRAIDGIGNVNFALGANRDKVGFAKLAPGTRCSGLSDGGENSSVQIQLQ
jgi:hypothetical protein